MAKMTLVVFKETGHVLGAVTRTTDPEGKLEAKEIVGDGLPLRDPKTGEHLLTVADQNLEVKIVDLVLSVPLSPLGFVLVGDIPEQGERYASAIMPVSVSSGTLTLTINSAPAEDLEAWVQVSGDAIGAIVRKLDIASGTDTATATLGLNPGEYAALLMVPGYQALATPFTAT